MQLKIIYYNIKITNTFYVSLITYISDTAGTLTAVYQGQKVNCFSR